MGPEDRKSDQSSRAFQRGLQEDPLRRRGKGGVRGVQVGRAPVTCTGFHHSLGEAGRVCSHLWIFNVFNFVIKCLFCVNFICPIIPFVLDIFTL